MIVNPSDSAHETGLSVADRLGRLFDHLGIDAAHVGTSLTTDVAPFLAARPDGLASLTLLNPARIVAEPLQPLAERTIIFSGDAGPGGEAIEGARDSLAKAEVVTFENYQGLAWSDIAADHAERIGPTMMGFVRALDDAIPATRLAGGARSGEVAGITYEIAGEGPAVVLFPAAIAPSQWAPVTAWLAERYAVVTLGGAHVGFAAVLEDRGRDASYRRVLRGLLDDAGVGRDDRLLEVGCGTGVVLRWLVRERRCGRPVTGVDLNPFFLKEAHALAEREGLTAHIDLHEGNAEALPFDDGAFDVVLSTTVLEECDADRALAEMVRVVRPGGRVAVEVRAADMPLFWNVPVDADLKAKADIPFRSVGPAGCADASLLERFHRAGLRDVSAYPHFHGTGDADGPMWALYQSMVTQSLDAAETRAWRDAVDGAARAGTAFMVQPVHCAVGTKPA